MGKMLQVDSYITCKSILMSNYVIHVSACMERMYMFVIAASFPDPLILNADKAHYF